MPELDNHGSDVEKLLDLYRKHPHTTGTVRAADRALATDLCSQGVQLDTIDAALLLVAARRSMSTQQPPPLIRSLHYFLPAIRELGRKPIEQHYLQYLRQRTITQLGRLPRLP
jgi:hypothetical protein